MPWLQDLAFARHLVVLTLADVDLAPVCGGLMLAGVVLRIRSLRVLELRRVTRLSDASMALIGAGSSSLNHIDVRWCSPLRLDVLRCLAERHWRTSLLLTTNYYETDQLVDDFFLLDAADLERVDNVLSDSDDDDDDDADDDNDDDIEEFGVIDAHDIQLESASDDDADDDVDDNDNDNDTDDKPKMSSNPLPTTTKAAPRVDRLEAELIGVVDELQAAALHELKSWHAQEAERQRAIAELALADANDETGQQEYRALVHAHILKRLANVI
jgi:hypothetical protein